MAKLLVQESNGSREFELVDLEVNIGRELDNTLRLADPSISRHHAVMRRGEGGWTIQDLGSSNGVLINGEKVDLAPLKDADRITLGQMQLTFIDPQAATINPLGTVRMDASEMAKIQAGGTIALEAPAAPPPPPPPPAPAPRPFVPPAPAGHNPAPAFLQGYLPPVPDDAQPILAGGGIERGGFGDRFLAWFIDTLIFVGAWIVFMVAVAVLSAISLGLGFLGCLIYPLLGIGYLVFQLWCMVTFRATLGKKIMKLRVVPEDNPAGNIDWGAAILRTVGHLVSGWLAGLPYLLILGSERKGLQDMFSKSVVIKVDR